MTLTFRPSILYVDDEQANLDTFRRAFAQDFLVKTCTSGAEAWTLLQQESFALLIADQKMPSMTGIELCEKAIAVSPQTVRLILTAYSEPELLLQAINRGHVHDYIVKPWRRSELKPRLDEAFQEHKARSQKAYELERRAQQTQLLEEDIQRLTLLPKNDFIGDSKPIQELKNLIQKVAPTEASVLIQGETGTGKERVARLIHEQSTRKNKPFVAIHCAALAPNLWESELFGHIRGAFTGADQDRKGRFEMAHGGTLFLDELGEISEALQVKLLRVLQEREIYRVGEGKAMPIDIRIIAATNRNLLHMIQDNRFRDDLYHRLCVIAMTLPPLRDRGEDILVLARSFLHGLNGRYGKTLSFSETAEQELMQYDWPGNVRELQNVLERAVILAEGSFIEVTDLQLPVQEMKQAFAKPNPSNSGTLESVRQNSAHKEGQELIKVLETTQGNLAEAARLLNVPRSTLFYRLKKIGWLE